MNELIFYFFIVPMSYLYNYWMYWVPVLVLILVIWMGRRK